MRALLLAFVVAGAFALPAVASTGVDGEISADGGDASGAPIVGLDAGSRCVTYSTSGDAHVNAKGCLSSGPSP